MKKTGEQAKKYTPAMRRRLRKAICDFHVRAFGQEMARVNQLPLAARRRYIAEMADHAARKGVKSDKPALGVTP
jgi:hypothetical protein